MGGKEYSQEDTQYYEKVSFEMNILVCGDYIDEKLNLELDEIKLIEGEEGEIYMKKGKHKITILPNNSTPKLYTLEK